MLKILLVILAFILTFLGVELFRRWGLRREILDLPNQRSSHTRPTPVGAGLVIAAVSLFCYGYFLFYYEIEIPWGYIFGAVIILMISWLDDLFGIPVIWRFLCHSIAACIGIWAFDGFSQVDIFFFGAVNLYGFAPVLLFLWVVWMINAYNFMDGIDGIAGMQALTAGVGWFLLSNNFGLEATGFYALILTASNLGFILLNWQPAKIFMGDVGSAFLGYTFALLPLMAGREMPQRSRFFFVAAVLLLWLFIFDTVVTVISRIVQKKKIWEAHREHLYQKIVIRGYSHQFAALLYGSCSAVITVFLYLTVFHFENIEFLTFSVIILISAGIFVFARKESVIKC